jgi:hypothetical protein
MLRQLPYTRSSPCSFQVGTSAIAPGSRFPDETPSIRSFPASMCGAALPAPVETTSM